MRNNYALLAHRGQFSEVKVDPALGQIRVTRAIEVSAYGKIVKLKASHSQEFAGSSGASAWLCRKRQKSITATAAS